ncbi:S-layer homology domain-containing protein [Paenibacillus paeoniae]|uniref:S-layer homology domain-containing protein n=1 Tax=Paenibacillus paeoniae TaxID=2292705 RepID=A0A371PND0_9BACL|nr:S-layer homology domain-containing protein [Paenibacillus paeoniae]REK77706.1 S-layer homology domain-containing protein [Paenibacillus paeoniae]
MMKKTWLLLVIMASLLVPNTMFAKAEDYGTIIWEGVLANTSYGGDPDKIRITIKGAVGKQTSKGKVNTHVRSLPGGSERLPSHIISVVDGGSIKVEYLGDEPKRTYQNADGLLGLTEIKELEQWEEWQLTDGRPAEYIGYGSGYIDPSKFFVNKNFSHTVGADRKVDSSDLSYKHVKDQNYIAKIYLPMTVGMSDVYIQVVSNERAVELMDEIKDGHPTVLLGKTFGEDTSKQPNDIWEAKLPPLKKSDLETRYGIKIHVEKGFFTEQEALHMLNQGFSAFPKGLIKEITSYYKNKGRQTQIKFVYKQTILSGSFNDEGKDNVLSYYPGTSGDFSHWVIGHEMGHYVHKYLNDRFGYEKLRQQWVSLNDGLDYKGKWSDKHSSYFVRDYSLSGYSEDVATIFELLTNVNNAELRKRYSAEDEAPILKKIDLLNKVLLEASSSVKDLNQIWGSMYPQSPSSYAVYPIEEARESGIVPADDRFQAIYQSNITREEFSLLAVNLIEKATGKSIAAYAKAQGVKKEWYFYGSLASGSEDDGQLIYRIRSNFPFSDISNEAIYDLHSLGVINGVGDKLFDPNGHLTREQAAVIMHNMAKALKQDTKSVKTSYADSRSTSSWAQEGIQYVSAKEIMVGTGQNRFSPKTVLTFEQAFIMLNRLLDTVSK